MDQSCNQEFGKTEFLSEADKRRTGHLIAYAPKGSPLYAAQRGRGEGCETWTMGANNEPVPPWDYKSAKPKN